MKDLEFELTSVTKDELEENIKRAKKKRRRKSSSHLYVDEREQEYLWNRDGRRLAIIGNRIVVVTKNKHSK